MRDIAKSIELDQEGLIINGEKFPWHIGADVTVTNDGGLKSVTVKIFCEDEVVIGDIPGNCTINKVEVPA